jgi:hypothetical protein
MVDLKIQTKNYQVFDLGYGCIVVDRNVDKINAEKGFNSVFIQGDDANEFIKEVDGVLSKKVNLEIIDNWLSGYSDVMELMEAREFEKIGVNVSQNKKKLKP